MESISQSFGWVDSCVREFWISNLVKNVAAVSQTPGLSEFLIHCILKTSLMILLVYHSNGELRFPEEMLTFELILSRLDRKRISMN